MVVPFRVDFVSDPKCQESDFDEGASKLVKTKPLFKQFNFSLQLVYQSSSKMRRRTLHLKVEDGIYLLDNDSVLCLCV